MTAPVRRGRLRLAVFGAVVLALLAPAGCASDGGSESAGAPTTMTSVPTTTSAPARCAATDPDGPRAGRRTLAHDGVERSYLIHLPDSAATREPRPLIIELHGYASSAEDLEARTGLGAKGAARGAVVVTPDGLGSPARWNFDRRPDGPDDYGFIDALVTDLEARYCIDPDRVFVVGSSNGAAFAGFLACTEPYRFAAVAMVIATAPTTGCPDAHRPSVLTIRGTADAHVPFAGTPELVAEEAERAGCDAEPRTEHPASDVDRTRYTGCRAGREVVLDAVNGGTHRWPVPAPGSADGSYDATDEVLSFFESRS